MLCLSLLVPILCIFFLFPPQGSWEELVVKYCARSSQVLEYDKSYGAEWHIDLRWQIFLKYNFHAELCLETHGLLRVQLCLIKTGFGQV